jgi:hypothetical protein
VAFEQPVLAVVARELVDAGREFVEGVEALDPQDLFVEGPDELLDERAMPRKSISAS